MSNYKRKLRFPLIIANGAVDGKEIIVERAEGEGLATDMALPNQSLTADLLNASEQSRAEARAKREMNTCNENSTFRCKCERCRLTRGKS